MAGGHVIPVGETKIYPGRLTSYALFACMVASFGGLIFGYDIGISGDNLLISLNSIDLA